MKQEPTDGKLVSENSWVHIKEDGQVIKEEHERINDAEASDSGDAEEGKNFELMSNKSSSPAKEEGGATLEQSNEEVLEDVQEFGANLSGLTNYKQIDLLAKIRGQVSFRYHPLNIIV